MYTTDTRIMWNLCLVCMLQQYQCKICCQCEFIFMSLCVCWFRWIIHYCVYDVSVYLFAVPFFLYWFYMRVLLVGGMISSQWFRSLLLLGRRQISSFVRCQLDFWPQAFVCMCVCVRVLRMCVYVCVRVCVHALCGLGWMFLCVCLCVQVRVCMVRVCKYFPSTFIQMQILTLLWNANDWLPRPFDVFWRVTVQVGF